ncbi:Protein JAZ13 [Hirschfeldia incana]|nr:Protein JAZ13 [Hirschfeldia incana]
MENCSLDLCLSPVTSSLQSFRRDSKASQSLARRTKKINGFYSGEVIREYDLVETQIRAVIEMASKERDITVLELAPVRRESPLGFSVKRSVERFLEKRKRRSKCVVTPYSYTCSSTSSSSSHHF